jgi:transcriptional regulator with GAF, ATPase, and Fis domain
MDGGVVMDAEHNADSPVGDGVEQLQELLLDSEDVQAFLDGLVAYFAEELTSSEQQVFCAVTMMRERTAVTVASSGPQAARMDEIQYSIGDGPCMTAARNCETVLLTDVLDSTALPMQWGNYGAGVAGSGIRSVLAVPLLLDGEAQGALNLYSTSANAFDRSAVAAAERSAVRASPMLRLAVQAAQLSETNSDLMAAMRSRTIIDMALGILMAQNRCGHEEAFRILQHAAAAREVRLQSIAATVVAAVTGSNIDADFSSTDTGPTPGPTA